jgi:hypothetical protein
MKPRKNHAVYMRSLNHLVDELFEVAYQRHLTWSKLATASGLAYDTVRRLGERKTRYPQYRSVQLLTHALGGTVQWKVGVPGKREYTWTPKVFAA